MFDLAAKKQTVLHYLRSFVLPFFGILFLFYPELFLGKVAPLVSDHWVQHYPWAQYLSECLKQGFLPLWMDAIHLGFPIAAESQIGIFYIPNLILLKFLPLAIAYSWLAFGHYFFSGFGLYLYSISMRMRPAAAMLTACLFVFGTAYGGAYYNVTSLKTISWMPWLLWCFEKYGQNGKKRYLLGITVAVGQSLLAGYLQVAALMLLMVCLYYLMRLFLFRFEDRIKKHTIRSCFLFLCAGLLGVMMALPQVLLTFQLAIRSHRTELVEGFAYVGSMSPLALSTLIFPQLQPLFRGNCLYISILALFFICYLFSSGKSSWKSRPVLLWSIMFLFSLFMALGRWSPLYVLLIKLTNFYSFRTPSKFLVFSVLSLCVLAGYGFHLFLNHLEEKSVKKEPQRNYRWFLLGGAISFLGSYSLFRWGRDLLVSLGEKLLRATIYGQPGHPHEWEVYQQKLDSFLQTSLEMLNPLVPFNLWFLMVALLCFWLCSFLGKCKKKVACVIVFLIVLVECYVFAGKDMKTDFASYQEMQSIPTVVQALLTEKEAGLLKRVYTFKKMETELSFLPTANRFFGFDEIGAYSPLILGRYHESIGQFGNVNDSTYEHEPGSEFVSKRIELLSDLGVSHIIAIEPLIHPSLVEIYQNETEGLRLYRNQSVREPWFFTSDWRITKGWEETRDSVLSAHYSLPREVVIEREALLSLGIEDIIPQEEPVNGRILLRQWKDHEKKWDVSVDGPGFFIVIQTFFPGWQAEVNGLPAKLIKTHGLFQGVYLPKAGEYTITFRYSFRDAIRGQLNDS